MNILFQLVDREKNKNRLGVTNIFRTKKNINFHSDNFKKLSNIICIIKKHNINVIIFTNTEQYIDELKKQFPNILFCSFLHGIYQQYVQVQLPKNIDIHWSDFENFNRIFKSNKKVKKINSLPSIDYLFYLKNNPKIISKYNFINNNKKNLLYITSHHHFDISNNILKNLMTISFNNNFNLILIIHPRKRNDLEEKICDNKMNILEIWDKNKEFIKNNLTVADNAYLYEYIVLSNLIICSTTSTTAIECISINKNIIFFPKPKDLERIDKKGLIRISEWNSTNKHKYDCYLLDKFKFNILSLDNLFDTDKINHCIVEHMNKKLRSYSNTERNNILNYYFNNTNFSENTASNKIINDIQKLLKNK